MNVDEKRLEYLRAVCHFWRPGWRRFGFWIGRVVGIAAEIYAVRYG